jgi:Arc/MetJ-type ribon-helix-helix transcriptional regulator
MGKDYTRHRRCLARVSLSDHVNAYEKTSITLSAELIRQIDALTGHYGTRSALIEQAVGDFLAAQTKRAREAQDLEILNRRAEALNAEAEDVLRAFFRLRRSATFCPT